MIHRSPLLKSGLVSSSETSPTVHRGSGFLVYRTIILASIFFFCNLASSFASHVEIDVQRLADSIKVAEGSTKHPYGILKAYCKPNDPDGQCRKGCIQTINKWQKKLSYTSPEDFIRQFGTIYCPIGADNDPSGLNKNWVRNVTKIYQKKGVKNVGS